MAVTSTTNWQISATGNDANGGLFDPGSTGTDYSQQDTAQASGTNLATTASSAVVTDAVALAFTSAMVGNGINIAGTIYQVLTFTSSSSITLDRTIAGTTTGNAWKVGGALLTAGYCAAQLTATTASANDVYQASGAYSVTSATQNVANGRVNVTIGGTSQKPFRWIGHKAGNRSDLSVQPVTTCGNSVTGSFFSFAVSGVTCKLDNVTIIGGTSGMTGVTALSGHIVQRVKVRNMVTSGFNATLCLFLNCEADTCVTGFTGRCTAINCTAHGCTTTGFMVNSGSSYLFKCRSFGNATGYTIQANVFLTLSSCMAYGNSATGFNCSVTGATPIHMDNCVSYGNSAYGFSFTAGGSSNFMINCAAGSNTSGAISGTNVNVENQIALTANPFTNAGTLDFSYNNTAGGGALLRGLSFPLSDYGVINLNNIDIGASNHADPSATASGRGRGY